MNDCTALENPLVFTPFCNPQTRETCLLLDLPAERKDEWAFYCNDEYDLPVLDARIVINAQALADALAVYSQHPETFGSVSISISIGSSGYEGTMGRFCGNVSLFHKRGRLKFQTAFLLPMRYKKHQTLGMIYIMVYTNIRL